MEPEKPHQPEDQQPQEIQQPAQPPEALLPGIAVQMRAALSNLHLAALQLAPPAKRDEDRSWISGPPFWIRAITVCCGW